METHKELEGPSSNNEGAAQTYELKEKDHLPSSSRKEKRKKKKNKEGTEPVIEKEVATYDHLIVEDSYSAYVNRDEKTIIRRTKKKKKKSSIPNEETNNNYVEDYYEDSWECALKNMEQGLDFACQSMVQLLHKPGLNKYHVRYLQLKLLLQSLPIRKSYALLILKILKKEYESEQEKHDLLKKLKDLEVEHVQLISNALTDLVKGRYK